MGVVVEFFFLFLVMATLNEASRSPRLVPSQTMTQVQELSPLIPSSSPSSLLSYSSSSSSTTNCTELESETEGPYWVEESIVNAYMTQNLSYGLPLNITFKVVNATLSIGLDYCVPVEGARIDIWHARYDGVYSDVQQEHTLNETWLRGAELTNSTGHATFYTIYPGWYTSRTVHIHMRVRTYDLDGNTTYEDTTQLYFNDTITDEVFTNVYPYSERSVRDTNNTNDDLFTASNLMTLVGDYVEGYTTNVEFSIPFTNSEHSSNRFLTSIPDDE